MATTKWMVQAADRTSLGHPGSWRAGQFFASGAPTEVEVVDQDEDPARDPDKDTGTLKVGRKSWEAIQRDKTLAKWPAGDESKGAKTSEDVGELRSMVERLTNENNRLKAQIAEASTTAAGTSGAGSTFAAAPVTHRPAAEAGTRRSGGGGRTNE